MLCHILLMTIITIPGPAAGKARPRMTKTGHTYTPRQTRDYEQLVRKCAAAQTTDYYDQGTPLRMSVIAGYAIPKSTKKDLYEKMIAGEIRPTKKPDGDNVLKILADALQGDRQPGHIYYDDSQIVEMSISKVYQDDPAVIVTIEEVRT